MSPALKDLLADLITEDRWSATVLGRIFSASVGEWMPLPSLIDGLRDAVDAYAELGPESRKQVVCVRLRHPSYPDEAGLVIFYDDTELDTTISIVNFNYLKALGITDR